MVDLNDFGELERFKSIVKKFTLIDVGSLFIVCSVLFSQIGYIVNIFKLYPGMGFVIGALAILIGYSRRNILMTLKTDIKNDDSANITLFDIKEVKMDSNSQIEIVIKTECRYFIEYFMNFLSCYFNCNLVAEYHSDQFEVDVDSRFVSWDEKKNSKLLRKIDVTNQINKETFNCSTLVIPRNYDDKNKIFFFIELVPKKNSKIMFLLRFILSRTFIHVYKKDFVILSA